MEFMDLCPRIWIKRERNEMQVLLFKYFFFNPMQFLLSYAKKV